MKLIMLGAPGAGKGTQAEAIALKYNLPTISTGNLLREAIKNGTETGMKAKSFMDGGQLVPDSIVIALLKERMTGEDCKDGFILDGFPRTVNQAKTLEEMDIIVDKVIDIDVKDDKIVGRLSGRRVCESCGASYHIDYKPTTVPGICNKCDGKTVLRNDDKPETVLERLKVYHNQTAPLKEYYAAQNKLFTVVGQEEITETTRLTFKAVEA